MYDGHTTGDARYRRTQCGRIARVPLADGRSAPSSQYLLTSTHDPYSSSCFNAGRNGATSVMWSAATATNSL